MKSANGGFWYKVGTLSCWRRGTETEVREYANKFTIQYTQRHAAEPYSWRRITRERFLYGHPDAIPFRGSKKRG